MNALFSYTVRGKHDDISEAVKLPRWISSYVYLAYKEKVCSGEKLVFVERAGLCSTLPKRNGKIEIEESLDI